MSELITLTASKRDVIGKGASRRLRKEETIPGIIYGKSVAPVSLQFEHRDLLRLIKNKAALSSLIHLDVDGQAYKVLVKDIQRHVYKNKVMHIEFQALSSDDIVLAEVPLNFVNADKAVGFKKGGQISINMKSVRVRCSALHIPAEIIVDIANLDLEQVLHLSQIEFPAGSESYDLLHGKEHDLAVIAIHADKSAQ